MLSKSKKKTERTRKRDLARENSPNFDDYKTTAIKLVLSFDPFKNHRTRWYLRVRMRNGRAPILCALSVSEKFRFEVSRIAELRKSNFFDSAARRASSVLPRKDTGSDKRLEK